MPGLYPRTISVYRPTPTGSGASLTPGLVGYQGLAPSNETPIFSGIPASIQAEALGNTKTSDVASSAPGPIKWSIFVPRAALQLDDVRTADIVVDDIGDRYQVAAAYWNLLGYKLMLIRLEA